LLLSGAGLRIVSSGRPGLGLGDSQELKKDWMNGSRFCPFWKKQFNVLSVVGGKKSRGP